MSCLLNCYETCCCIFKSMKMRKNLFHHKMKGLLTISFFTESLPLLFHISNFYFHNCIIIMLPPCIFAQRILPFLILFEFVTSKDHSIPAKALNKITARQKLQRGRSFVLPSCLRSLANRVFK